MPQITNDHSALPTTTKPRYCALADPAMTWSITTRISAALTGLATE